MIVKSNSISQLDNSLKLSLFGNPMSTLRGREGFVDVAVRGAFRPLSNQPTRLSPSSNLQSMAALPRRKMILGPVNNFKRYAPRLLSYYKPNFPVYRIM
jgi:hypothetical protein